MLSLRSPFVVDHVLTSKMRHQNGTPICHNFVSLRNPARKHYVGFPNFDPPKFSGLFSGPNSGALPKIFGAVFGGNFGGCSFRVVMRVWRTSFGSFCRAVAPLRGGVSESLWGDLLGILFGLAEAWSCHGGFPADPKTG